MLVSSPVLYRWHEGHPCGAFSVCHLSMCVDGQCDLVIAWKKCVENDLKRLNLHPSMAADRESWSWLLRVSVWPVLARNTTFNDWLVDWLIDLLLNNHILYYIFFHNSLVVTWQYESLSQYSQSSASSYLPSCWQSLTPAAVSSVIVYHLIKLTSCNSFRFCVRLSF